MRQLSFFHFYPEFQKNIVYPEDWYNTPGQRRLAKQVRLLVFG